MNVVVKEVAPAAGALFKGVQTKALALKCDLCSHREGGPACVEVCPTQALRLVTPASLDSLNRQKQLASAEAMPSSQRA
ncbi:Electron transport protein HydN [compost metagenome]